jgi:hypothetical protein
MSTSFNRGDRVWITGNHPWSGELGSLVRFEAYGPEQFGWQGWLVKIRGVVLCYADAEQIKPIGKRERKPK